MAKQKIYESRWDAMLDTDVCDELNNADLTLILKLCLKQINPAGGAAEGTHNDYGDPKEPGRKIIKWTKEAWTKWTTEFVNSAQKFWDKKFRLVNDFPVLEYQAKGAKFRPNIYCRLQIKLVEPLPPGIQGPLDINHLIEVVNLHPDETWFGSHESLYDSRDHQLTRKGKNSKGVPIMQRAHVHEVGHLLGLAHVDVGKKHCPVSGDTNATKCYGVKDHDKNNVMGAGMAISPNLALPWRQAMVKLTGKGNVIDKSDWIPKMQRHYPHSPAEVAAKRAITSRPGR